MKIYSKFYNTKDFFDIELNDLDCSLFVDDIPFNQDQLSNINVMVLLEPNEYFGMHDWVIENQHLFSLILTWSDKVLNNCPQSIYLPFGTTWLKENQYNIEYNKEFRISHLRGDLLKTSGHLIRHEYHSRSKNEIKIPSLSVERAGDRQSEESCALAKIDLFGNAQYGVVIENVNRRGYFSEKIMEMFLLKTIPIYWGCSNIGDFFNINGIITFNNVDDIIQIANNLDKNYYNSKLKYIEENYNLAMNYVHVQTNIINKIKEVFKLNKIIK